MSAKPRAFIDTNIVIYAFAESSGPDAAKIECARQLLLSAPVISVQVLNEFANVARKKLGWNWHSIRAALNVVREAASDVRPIDIATHVAAIEMADTHCMSFYDAAVVASAVLAECEVLFTEDLQHGFDVAGVLQITNPFLD